MGLPGKITKKVWMFPSSSYEKNGKTYETIQYTDGSTSCNCPGWTRHVAADGSRNCKHVRNIDMGRADAAALSSHDYTQSGQTPEPQPAKKTTKKKPGKGVSIARKIIWD